MDLVNHSARGVFITGTDTGVGKTLVACGIISGLADSGLRVVGMKPVAAGAACGVWEDVEALRSASNVAAPADVVSPYRFEPAIAPHIAAERAGIVIDLARIVSAYSELASRADAVVVEGAGGFLVPLGPGLTMADLAVALKLPVVLVVGLRLGCLNHALLTAEAIRGRGLALAGWVANRNAPSMDAAIENIAALHERLGCPLLAEVPTMPEPDVRTVSRLLQSGGLERRRG